LYCAACHPDLSVHFLAIFQAKNQIFLLRASWRYLNHDKNKRIAYYLCRHIALGLLPFLACAFSGKKSVAMMLA
jgi:hypothetical protein